MKSLAKKVLSMSVREKSLTISERMLNERPAFGMAPDRTDTLLRWAAHPAIQAQAKWLETHNDKPPQSASEEIEFLKSVREKYER